MKKKNNQSVKSNKKTILIILGGILAIMIVAIVIVAVMFNGLGEKVYEVGKDIEAGEYVLVGIGKHSLLEELEGESERVYGYYAVCTTKECDIDNKEMVVNDNVTGKAYVIVEDGQYLETHNMKLYKVDKYKTTIKNSISYDYELGASDYYKIGKDLSSGTYTFTGDAFYYAVCNRPSCDVLKDEIITNEFSDTANGSSTITVENGQYLIVSSTKPFTVTK